MFRAAGLLFLVLVVGCGQATDGANQQPEKSKYEKKLDKKARKWLK